MKIYIRKIFPHDITHEVSLKTGIVSDFFDNMENFNIKGKSSQRNYIVTINNATDPRFGGEFKSMLEQEGGIQEGDLIVILKIRNRYELELIKPSNEKYSTLSDFFLQNERHAVLNLETALDRLSEDRVLGGYNRIYYGTPGSGKSYFIENIFLKEEQQALDEDVFRTIFYQDYTHSDFIGQIMPIINEDGMAKYEFSPGPLALSLKKAYDNPNKYIYLIIEEINRGNAASIFGDLFQLLDRSKETSSLGESEYSINKPDLQSWLEIDVNEKIKFPSNFVILGTMNTSDQNVFTLDAAFKRRWSLEKIKNTFDGHPYKDMYIPGHDITWENFVNKVNNKIVDSQQFSTEDKCIGVYFVDKSILSERPNVIDNNKQKKFASKVIEYIYNDVAKMDRESWFNDEFNTLDDLIEAFIERREIFADFNLIESDSDEEI